MTQPPDLKPAGTPERPKWFLPGMLALAFTLSFIGAEMLGPLGAILGIVLAVAAGWALTKWVFKSGDVG
ncbi:hypothetical protein PVW48_02155 [Dinoroseobacter sp. PD6]|uniref:hypothetical protein n=1 Tax=Dinoroseobacter sp. PD6 TaxID=3028384 RepID=UPI00237A68AC|nr:hypothetical protein [Dinoroseobacter sp. PD6]MDD9715533.1 hypothetical protein [Dinoroseobacter sp. PD6]